MAPEPPLTSDTLAKQSVHAALRELCGKRILLVDDYPLNQELALAFLASVGAEIVVAGDGLQALEILQREQFDAVLMDCQMPVMDGYEATRRIRSIDRFKNLPVIALTAHASKDDRERCLAAGRVDHISKPVKGDQLYVVLARWIRPSNRPEPGWIDARSGPRAEDVPESVDWKCQLVGIDTEAGLAIVMEQEAFYIKMLRIFLDTQTDFERRFLAAMDDGKADAAQRMAHNLKSGAGAIGASTVQFAASALEATFGHAEPASQTASMLANLSAELQPVLAGLRRALRTVGDQCC